jgi:hypothetical protein
MGSGLLLTLMNISRCMRHVNGVYAHRFNRYHREDGQLLLYGMEKAAGEDTL